MSSPGAFADYLGDQSPSPPCPVQQEVPSARVPKLEGVGTAGQKSPGVVSCYHRSGHSVCLVAGEGLGGGC
jgi:hypothetical protein